MSSNGVMLQDYVPNAINNITEQIWCAGAVIPAGKRVVIGHMRDGWLEVTFTMGKTEDFIGMAMVPPSVVGIEEPVRIPGVGFMPQGVAAMAMRSRSQPQWEPPFVSSYDHPAARPQSPVYVPPSHLTDPQFPNCPQGQVVWAHYKITAPSSVAGRDVQLAADVLTWLRNNPDARSTIDYFFCAQPASTVQPGQFTFSEAARRARMEQALPANQPRSPAYVPPYQWGGLHGSEGTGYWPDQQEDLPEGFPEAGAPGTGLMPQGVAAMVVRSSSSRTPNISGRAVSFNALFQHGWPMDGLVTVDGQSRAVHSFTMKMKGDTDWDTYFRNNPYWLMGLNGQVSLNGNSFTGTVRVMVGQHTFLGYATVSGTLVGANETISPSQPTSQGGMFNRLGPQSPTIRSPEIDQNPPLPPANVSNAPVAPDCPPGQSLWVRGTDELGRAFDNPAGGTMATVLRNNPHLRSANFYCRSNIETSSSPGQNTFAETARRARMSQALPASQPRSPAYAPPPYQWGGLHGMMPGAVRDMLRGMGARRPGVGAAGASAFTMAAAQALNDHLVTNSCAGCSDMTSQLRQLTFAFKAAVMTDTGIAPAMNLNMSSALAMTAYGSGTDQALKNVLGAAGTYANGPCTDDNGNCLGNLPTPIVPNATSALEVQFVHAIQTAIQQAQYIPQPELVKGLVQGFVAFVNQIGVELAKVKPVVIVTPAPPAPPATTAPAKSVWPTIVVGGLIGSAVLATGALVYTHARRA